MVRTDAASLWATGVTWWQAPPVARVVLRGALRPGVVGKDVIVALCGLFNHDEVRGARSVDIHMDHSVDMHILFDPGHGLDERIVREQFRP